MKTVFIHIGPPKTGSTTIQLFLSENKDKLLQHGVLYPGAGRVFDRKSFAVQRKQNLIRKAGCQPSHFFLGGSLMGEVKGLDPDECWASVATELAETSVDTAIISGEIFFRLPTSQVRRIRAYLEGYNVKVIAYLRDPFGLVSSHYNQDVKMGRYSRSFHNYIRERVDRLFNYYTVLDRWGSIFGDDHISVRPYEKLARSDELERDLLELIGVNWCELGNVIEPRRANLSLPPEAIRIMRLLNRLEHRLPNGDTLHRMAAKLRSRVQHGAFPFNLLVRLAGKFLRSPLYSSEARAACYAHLGSKYTAVVDRWIAADQRHLFTINDAAPRQSGSLDPVARTDTSWRDGDAARKA